MRASTIELDEEQRLPVAPPRWFTDETVILRITVNRDRESTPPPGENRPTGGGIRVFEEPYRGDHLSLIVSLWGMAMVLGIIVVLFWETLSGLE